MRMSNPSITAALDAVTELGKPLATPFVMNAPLVGDAAGRMLVGGVKRYGTASTGTPIRVLEGIAAERAALAAIGRGTLVKGGSGVVGGNRAVTMVKAAPVFIAGVTLIALATRKIVLDVRADKVAAFIVDSEGSESETGFES
jgi:hypothetical protein